jgi:hypothetical protein
MRYRSFACFCLRLLQERNGGVGLLPQSEEVLVGQTARGRVTAGDERSGQLQARDRAAAPAGPPAARYVRPRTLSNEFALPATAFFASVGSPYPTYVRGRSREARSFRSC